MDLKIKLHNDNCFPEQMTTGDWIDLKSSVDLDIKAGEFHMIPLGVSIQLPAGYEAIIAPRSSLFKKHSLIVVNSIGIIDESYCGNDDIWQLPVFAFTPTHIHAGERICQFRLLKHQDSISFVPVKKLGNKNRGGFGSTD